MAWLPQAKLACAIQRPAWSLRPQYNETEVSIEYTELLHRHRREDVIAKLKREEELCRIIGQHRVHRLQKNKNVIAHFRCIVRRHQVTWCEFNIALGDD
jgi:hypothetical protein